MANLTSRINEVVGGGGGLTVVFQTTDFTAEAGNIYRCTDTVTAIQMPTIADGDRIVISPSEDAEWSSNSITVTPSAGETIDEDNGAVADETYILNLSGVDKVEMTGKLSTTNWEVDTPVTPSSIGNGAFVGEWEASTVTCAQTANTTTTSIMRRSGDTAYFRVDNQYTGAPNAANMVFTLPPGLNIDTSKLTTTTDSEQVIGHWRAVDVGTLNYDGAVVYSNGNIVSCRVSDATGAFDHDSPFVIASGDFITVEFAVPILEWNNTGTTLTVSDFSAKTKVFTPTFSSTPAGWSLIGATMMFYRDSDDNYRARFNVLADHTSAGQVGFRFTELDSVGVLPFNQACTARPRSNTSASMAVIDTNGNVTTTHITANDDLINVAGDVLLSGKPTDFDDHAENNFNIDVHFQEATPTVLGLSKALKWQRKILSSDLLSTTGDVADLRFNNLTIGMTYHIWGMLAGEGRVAGAVTSAGCQLTFKDDTTQIGVARLNLQDVGTGKLFNRQGFKFAYTATATTMRVDYLENGAATLFGNSTLENTHVFMQERPNDIETADWT